MSTVILMNFFEVPAGEEEQFLSAWLQTAEPMRHASGFRSLRLHKSLDPQAKFRFVNVAEWESQEQWQEALKSQGDMRERWPARWPAYPALYEVVVE